MVSVVVMSIDSNAGFVVVLNIELKLEEECGFDKADLKLPTRLAQKDKSSEVRDLHSPSELGRSKNRIVCHHGCYIEPITYL